MPEPCQHRLKIPHVRHPAGTGYRWTCSECYLDLPEKAATTCRWFALCDSPATGTTPHPVLGNVPTCDRCHHFATGESR